MNLRRFRFASPTATAVGRFFLGGLAAAALISVGAFFVVNQNAVLEATRNAQEIAAIDGHGIVEPAISTALLDGDTQALSSFDTLVRGRVLSSRVVRVKLWTQGGKIVYSDAAELRGRVYPLPPEEIQAMRQDRVAAEVSDLSRPENQFERSFGRLLEVYVPVRSAGGDQLLFETYQDYSLVVGDQNRIWASFFPVLVGGVVLLFAVQLPLAWGMANNLEALRKEREALLQRALDASEVERRRIARDLHDGVVQNLAGVAFTLSASADKVAAGGVAADLREAADATRQATRDLRSLIVEISPPNLKGAHLQGALAELLLPVEQQGVETSLTVDGLERLEPDEAAVLYRSAQEAIRNAAVHSGATRVEVSARANEAEARMEVRDNGQGFTVGEVMSRQRHGHVGMAMIKTLVEDAGGEVAVRSQRGIGTTIVVALRRAGA